MLNYLFSIEIKTTITLNYLISIKKSALFIYGKTSAPIDVKMSPIKKDNSRLNSH